MTDLDHGQKPEVDVWAWAKFILGAVGVLWLAGLLKAMYPFGGPKLN